MFSYISWGFSRRSFSSWVVLSVALISPSTWAASVSQEQILERLLALEARQKALEADLQQRDQRIVELERQLSSNVADPPLQTIAVVPATGVTNTAPVAVPHEKQPIGRARPNGAGFTIADTEMGTINFGAWAYVRYLNQEGLDDSYTDDFGREFDIDIRNDMQFNKVNLTFNGWMYDPDFRYLLYTWTANTSQGDSAQVVVAGNFKYRFNKAFDVGFGIDALPGTRSMSGTFPFFNKVDNRTMADEYFRPSYTTGIWSAGEINPELRYKVMLGNNLSQLGVNAAKLDGEMNTFSARLDWMPRTGEFGVGRGFDDFEVHTELATAFGVSATYSEEDRQSQPGTEDIQNSQIRLSDGTRLFNPGAFGTDGRVNRATYQMVAADAGVKYQGWAILGEYYARWVDDFKTEGDVPEDELWDHGFQLQASYSFMPKYLAGYIAGSKIFGEYGDPWDTAVGVNWYPMRERLLRVNGEVLYLDSSAVGYSSIPYQVGGDGFVFNTNLEMKF